MMEFDARFPMLASPFTVGRTLVRNRIGLGPLNTGLHTGERDATSFYQQYADDGFGLVYIGGVAINAAGRSNRSSPWVGDPASILSLRRVTEMCSARGVRTVAQIMHAGRQARREETGESVVSATAAPSRVVGGAPQALDDLGVLEICRSFSLTARAMEDAGVDAIEVHAAHGYLLDSFLSEDVNDRRDDYGWSPTSSRILAEVLQAVRQATSLPIGIRVSVTHGPGAPPRPWLPSLLASFRDVLDFVAVSAGTYAPVPDLIMPSGALGELPWREEAARIRLMTGLPVLLSGNAFSLEAAERAVVTGQADAILFARTALAEPHLISKSRGGLETQPCTECGLCKWHSRSEPRIFCPFNEDLVSRRRRWLEQGGRPMSCQGTEGVDDGCN